MKTPLLTQNNTGPRSKARLEALHSNLNESQTIQMDHAYRYIMQTAGMELFYDIEKIVGALRQGRARGRGLSPLREVNMKEKAIVAEGLAAYAIERRFGFERHRPMALPPGRRSGPCGSALSPRKWTAWTEDHPDSFTDTTSG